MTLSIRRLSLVSCAIITVCALSFGARAAAAPGQTRVARWQGDRSAAFLLMFDDSMNTQVKNVVPELAKRGFVGTFYINPGKHPYDRGAWEQSIPKTGMVYGNHTWTHQGARDTRHLDEELAQSNTYIRRVAVMQKTAKLISYARPGVGKGKWNVSDAEERALLSKHRLVSRPPFNGHGGAIHVKTGAQMIRLVARAIEKKDVEYVIFHGVGGEWITVGMPDFLALMDHLAQNKSQVWVTDHISAHRYATERDAARVQVVSRSSSRIGLRLTCDADRALYDAPLTLVTAVPSSWTRCRVSQGTRSKILASDRGQVCYDAVPDGGRITIERAR